jgi:hypothetical protein
MRVEGEGVGAGGKKISANAQEELKLNSNPNG